MPSQSSHCGVKTNQGYFHSGLVNPPNPSKIALERQGMGEKPLEAFHSQNKNYPSGIAPNAKITPPDKTGDHGEGLDVIILPLPANRSPCQRGQIDKPVTNPQKIAA